jgi:hypothetical protein
MNTEKIMLRLPADHYRRFVLAAGQTVKAFSGKPSGLSKIP